MATATASTATTRWTLRGRGYEYCNCEFGGWHLSGFPSSPDGSCRALVGMAITAGRCGDVDLSGVKCAAIVHWPKAIHEGNGKCVFIVEPSTTERQIAPDGEGTLSARAFAGGRPHTPTAEGASCVPEVRGDRRRDATCRGVGRAGCYSATLQA